MSERPNWPRCPSCKSQNVMLVEMWSKHAISWEPYSDIDDGYEESGEATGVWGYCYACNHEWKLRKIHEIDPAWWEESE